MIFEMRTYTIRPGKVQDYLTHFRDVGLPIISRYATLVGYWHTEIGELNQLIHIWSYDSLDQRAERRAALYRDPAWISDFIPLAIPLLEKQENRIMLAADFSPIR